MCLFGSFSWCDICHNMEFANCSTTSWIHDADFFLGSFTEHMVHFLMIIPFFLPLLEHEPFYKFWICLVEVLVLLILNIMYVLKQFSAAICRTSKHKPVGPFHRFSAACVIGHHFICPIHPSRKFIIINYFRIHFSPLWFFFSVCKLCCAYGWNKL